MLEKQLKELHFGKNEIAVYLALFEFDRAKAGDLINYTNRHRNLVYESLEKLVSRGLVTKTRQNGVATFSANSPDTLLEEIEQKKEIAKKISEQLKQKHSRDSRDVSFYDGFEGVKTVTKKSLALDPGETLYVMGASKFSVKDEYNSYWKKYHKQRIKKNINFKILYDQSVGQETLDHRNSLPLSEARYMPENFSMPLWTYIHNDLCSFVIAKDEPLSISIRSKEIAETFLQYFQHLWGQSVYVMTGMDALEKAFYGLLNSLKPEEQYDVLGASINGATEEIKTFFDNFHKARIEKNVGVNILAYKEAVSEIQKRCKKVGDPNLTISDIRPLMDTPQIPLQIHMTKDKMFLGYFVDDPVVIMIDQKEIAQGFKAQFDEIWNQKTKTFRGNSGFYSAFGDITKTLKKGEELLIMGMFDFDPEFADMVTDFHTKRDELGIKARILLNERGKKIMGEPLEKLPNTTIKYMQKEKITPSIFLIYGDKTLITTPGQRTFIQIDNKDTSTSFRTHFESLWGQNTKTYIGEEGARTYMMDSLNYDDVYILGGNAGLERFHPKVWYDYRKLRIKNNVFWHDLIDPGCTLTSEDKSIGHAGEEELYEFKFLPKDVAGPHVIIIFGNKVANIIWKEESVISVIEDKEIAESYKKYWKHLWDKQP